MGYWKKAENEKGFFYYINEEINTQQWDHPKFSDVKQAIDDCNFVAYATYRLALKFRALQRCLYMEEVQLSIIIAIFERHRLGNNESSLTLETYDLEAVLSDIFFAANKKNHTNVDVEFATEIFINFLYNVFDSCREGKIQVVSTKMLLGILCNYSIDDLHKYLFSLCVNHNNCITRMRLQEFLNKIHLVIKYLHEDTPFGIKSINSAVENCFRDSPGLVGITESNFRCWLNSDVPFLSWMPLVLKLKSAETLMHFMKCTTCKTRPMLGLRYRCIRCPKYTQCQRCFLTGRISHSHKLSHSLREYSTVTANRDTSYVFLSKLCGLFCLSTIKQQHSIVKPSRQFANENIKPYQSTDPLCDVEPLSSPEAQLQGVIRKLESQNRELQQMLIFGNYSDKDMRKYLEEYRLFMAGNIKRLKILKNQINISTEHDIKAVEYPEPIYMPNIQSTPMMQLDKVGKCKNGGLEYNMSPITTMTEIGDSFCNEKGRENKNYVHLSSKAKNFDGYGAWNKDCHPPTHLPGTIKPKKTIDIPKSPVKLLHNDLDEALARLQQILANNFSLDESVNNMDNNNLKYAVTEVEGMLTSIIDNVESSRCNSALPGKTKS